MSLRANETYAEALEKARSKPVKPRTAMPRGTKGLNRGSLAQNGLVRDENGKTALPLKRGGIARRAATGKKGKGKPKKKTDGQLKKLVWKQFSIFIRTRGADENGMQHCYTCLLVAHWKTLEAGHLVPGRTNAVLFNELSVRPQCRRCNGHFRGNTIVFYPKMVAEHGQEVVDQIIAQRDVTHKWEPSELSDLLAKYKALNSANKLLQCESP